MTRAIQTRERVPQIVRGHAAVRRRPTSGPAGGPPVTTAPTSTISGRDIFRMLRKRMWWVIISVAFFGISASLTTYVWRQEWPQYSAEAEIAVNPRTFSASTEANLFTTQSSGILPLQHARRIRHRNFLNHLQDVMIQKTKPDNPDRIAVPWFQKSPGTFVSRLRTALGSSAIQNESVVRVTLTDVAPSDEQRESLAQVLNLIVQEYTKYVQQITQSGTTDAIRYQEKRKERLLIELDAVRKDIDKLDLPSTGMIGERMTAIANRLESFSQEQTRLELRINQIAAELQNLKVKGEAGKLDEVPELIQLIDRHPRIVQLRQEIDALESGLDRAREYLGPEHPSVIRAKKSLAINQEKMQKIRSEILDSQAKALSEQYIAAGRSTQAELVSLKDQNTGLKDTLEILQENLKRLTDLRAKERLALKYLNDSDNALINLRTKADEYTPVWVHAIPEPPDKDDIAKPAWTIMVPGGLVVGLILGLGLAFLLELLDTSIKGPRDLTRKIDLPILGMIPHAGDLEEHFECLPLAFQEHPNSPMDEAHRQIRTTLLFSGPVSQQRSLLITSPLPSDGRTTHTLNLAHSIAHSGRRVLAVDANFRQPAFRSLFPQLPQEGLSSILVGQVDWREVVTEVEPNLSVISSGPLPPNPAELLGSEQMLAAMAEMMEAYDQVLFDGGPCVVVTDPVSLATLVDGVILVVRAGSNSTGIVQRARDLFDRVGAHIIGVVLNGVRIEAGGYLRKNYETFYEYRERAMLPTLPTGASDDVTEP